MLSASYYKNPGGVKEKKNRREFQTISNDRVCEAEATCVRVMGAVVMAAVRL